MKVQPLELNGALLITAPIYYDNRGNFSESFNLRTFNELIGRNVSFVQDNVSISYKNVIRGLHFQSPHEQGKLVRVLRGKIYDVIVDIRKHSTTFGSWMGIELSADGTQLWIPEGFAHGFLTLTDNVEFMYKVTDYYNKACEHTIRWDDPTLSIDWPTNNPIVSEKDSVAKTFTEIQF